MRERERERKRKRKRKREREKERSPIGGIGREPSTINLFDPAAL